MVRQARRIVLALTVGSAVLGPGVGAGQESEAAEARGWLGLRIEQRYDCSWDTGEDWTDCDLVARVTGIEEEGPAFRAGLRVGDRVMSIEGRELTLESLAAALGGTRPGAGIGVDVVRDGARHAFRVIPADPPPDPVAIRMISRRAVGGDAASEVRVFVLKNPGPGEGDAAGDALTVRATEDDGVAVEPSAVRMAGGRLEVLLMRDRSIREAQERRSARSALLGSLERERESAYRDVALALERVREVRERMSSREFRRGLTRLAEQALAAPGLAARFGRTFAGAEFEPVRDFSGRPGLDGLLVLRVVPATATARLGLRAGDLLVRTGGAPVRSLEDLIAALRAAEGEAPTVEWIREGREVRRVAWSPR